MKKYFLLGVILLLIIVALTSFYFSSYVKSNEPSSISEFVYSNKTKLPKILEETSGLIYYNGLIWTLNDSGNEPEIYAYSEKKDAVKYTVTILNGENADWEEISQDSTYIYVGDFGNNYGTRNNLVIYKIDKKKINLSKGKSNVEAQKIEFDYPNYQPVPIPVHRSAFDCEAMVCKDDSIYLLTKNWTDATSSIYSLPKKAGKYMARKVGWFNSNGFVTAATVCDNKLYVLGYQLANPFLWVFPDFDNINWNRMNGVLSEFPLLQGTQTEGVCCINNSTIVFSSEKTNLPQSLYYLKINKN